MGFMEKRENSDALRARMMQIRLISDALLLIFGILQLNRIVRILILFPRAPRSDLPLTEIEIGGKLILTLQNAIE
jgi:hypothetical protein